MPEQLEKLIEDRMRIFDSFLTHRAVSIAEAHRRELSKGLERMGLTLAEFNIVGALLRHSRGMSQKALAGFLGLTAASVSASLDRLEKKKVITRTSEAGDSRVKKVAVNRDNLVNGSQIQDLLQNFETRALRGIPEEKKKIAREVLGIMRMNLASIEGD